MDADSVKVYYSSVLKSTNDLQTNACTSDNRNMPSMIKKILPMLHESVLEKYYGCGFPIPHLVENCRVMDIGCGAGRDCFLLSKLVGPKGYVVGLDMTEEMLNVAKANIAFHMNAFNYSEPNVDFLLANIEDASIMNESLCSLDSFDIITSNCVINLTTDKKKALKNIFQLLKPGGEFYFSDIYSSDRIPTSLQKDKVLWGECLSGALYWKDFVNMCEEIGFSQPLLVSASMTNIASSELKQKIEEESKRENGQVLMFASCTYRLPKLRHSASIAESKMCRVTYHGGIMSDGEEQEIITLDYNNAFTKEKARYCYRSLADFVSQSRFKAYFSVECDVKADAGDKQEDEYINPFTVANSEKEGASCCKKSSSCC